jgi:hypothetical protein
VVKLDLRAVGGSEHDQRHATDVTSISKTIGNLAAREEGALGDGSRRLSRVDCAPKQTGDNSELLTGRQLRASVGSFVRGSCGLQDQ